MEADTLKKTVYVFSGGVLRRKGNTIAFETEGERTKYLPIEDISAIMVFGDVDFNKKLLELLSQKQIVLHYFNYYGYYTGTFYPREHYNSGYMILRQAEHYLDATRRMVLARSLVDGAVKNIRQVLKYYANRGRQVEDLIEQIESLALGIKQCNNTSELMAIEGNIRERYYRAFDLIVGKPEFEFGERTRRPPRNYMNTLISFGNSIIYTTVLGEIYKTHLDPRIGYLHTTNFRRFTLNLDVAEIFKPILVDRVIFSLVGRNIITEKDFMKKTEGVFLNERGRKIFVEEMDKRLSTTIKHRSTGKSVSYRRMIRLELYKLEKHLMGEQDFSPFVAQW